MATFKVRTQCILVSWHCCDSLLQCNLSCVMNLILSFIWQSALSTGNYDTFVGHVTAEVTLQLEKAVLKTSFNRVCTREPHNGFLSFLLPLYKKKEHCQIKFLAVFPWILPFSSSAVTDIDRTSIKSCYFSTLNTQWFS